MRICLLFAEKQWDVVCRVLSPHFLWHLSWELLTWISFAGASHDIQVRFRIIIVSHYVSLVSRMSDILPKHASIWYAERSEIPGFTKILWQVCNQASLCNQVACTFTCSPKRAVYQRRPHVSLMYWQLLDLPWPHHVMMYCNINWVVYVPARMYPSERLLHVMLELRYIWYIYQRQIIFHL